MRNSGGSQSGNDSSSNDTIITSCDYAVEIVNHRINQILKHLIDQGATDGDVISRARNFIERLTHALRKRTSDGDTNAKERTVDYLRELGNLNRFLTQEILKSIFSFFLFFLGR